MKKETHVTKLLKKRKERGMFSPLNGPTGCSTDNLFNSWLGKSNWIEQKAGKHSKDSPE